MFDVGVSRINDRPRCALQSEVKHAQVHVKIWCPACVHEVRKVVF